MRNKIILIFLFFIYYCFGSKLQIFNSTIISNGLLPTLEYEIQTPPFALGNLNFPVEGQVLIVRGCNGIREADEDIVKNNYTSMKFIFLVEYEESDSSCLYPKIIFQCQDRSWCIGVLAQDPFYIPCGHNTWSAFDKARERSAYKVPLVEAAAEDFDMIRDYIIQTEKNKNYSYNMILTLDTNPWELMFKSTVFLVVCRIFTPIYSFSCLLLVLFLAFRAYLSKLSSDKKVKPKSINVSSCRISLKQLCLCFQGLTHVFRIVYSVDPFVSQQIYNNLASYLLAAFSSTFEVATNVLLSFVIRELTQANQQIDLFKRLRFAYGVVVFIISVDIAANVLAGLSINISNSPSWIVKFIIYVILNVILGCWYSWEGQRFLKKCSKLEKQFQKENRGRILLTQIAIVGSISILVFGCLSILVSIRSIFGNPWGYFSVFVSMGMTLQLTSLTQIALFGGTPVDVKKFLTKAKQIKEKYSRQHTVTI